MTLLLLGTGAADGIPGFFSSDPVSRYARENGGKDVRSRSAALLDGVIKIDLPPDTLTQLHREGLDAREWTAIVFTHSHEDHFAVSEIQYALHPFTEADHMAQTIYGNAAICARIHARYPHWPLEVVEMRSFHSVAHGDYRITPVHARHKEDEDSHNLLIERDGKRLLYATDTGVWHEETFEFLRAQPLDLLVIECTEGFQPTDYVGHLDVKDCIAVVERLRAQGTLPAGSRVVTTHHSHGGGARHCDLVRALAPHGIEPGYDGMRLEF